MEARNRKSIRLWLTAAAVLMLVWMGMPAAAGDVVFVAPVYLNGLPEYTLAGSAGLANIACDAALDAAGADAALLNGGLFASSLPAGEVTGGELLAAFRTDPELVTTEVTAAELTSALNGLLVYGSPDFPQVAGLRVLAERSLTETGAYCGVVSGLQLDGRQPDDDVLYTLATTAHLAQACHLPRRVQPLGVTLAEAVADYAPSRSAAELTQAASAERICIVSDTIDLSRAASQLLLRVPSPVVLDLTAADMIPDELIYALRGQSRYLCAWWPLEEIPYALCLDGTGIEAPLSVSTSLSVSRQVPSGRKTANTFSGRTVFVDLRGNDTIPEGARTYVDLSGIYPSGMLLFLYYYDDNGDIIPMKESAVVAENGAISLPVAGGMTYVINDRQLNQSALLAPTPQHPWTAAIAAVWVIFGLWVLYAIFWRRRPQ